MREVKGGKIFVKGIQHKRVQTSAGYSQNNPELARDCSDCNQHEFGRVCVRFILQKFYLPLTSLKRLSRWFYPTLIKITKILYLVLPNTIYYTIILQPLLEIYMPVEICFILLFLLLLLLCNEFWKSGISIYIIWYNGWILICKVSKWLYQSARHNRIGFRWNHLPSSGKKLN